MMMEDKGEPIERTAEQERAAIVEMVQQWQQDQSEYFQDTIVEIVSEYATWRERLASDPEANKAGGLWYRRWFEAQKRINELERIMENPPKHRFWGAGEADCPRDIKASNGELHTLRCKVCGMDNPDDNICRTGDHHSGETNNG